MLKNQTIHFQILNDRNLTKLYLKIQSSTHFCDLRLHGEQKDELMGMKLNVKFAKCPNLEVLAEKPEKILTIKKHAVNLMHLTS